MITNLEGLTNYLVSWMQEQAKESGTRNGCVGLSGGIDSAVVFALSCRAFPETVAVLMPCHSSTDSVNRAREVLRSQALLGYACRGITVPLETAFESIVNEVTAAEGHDTRFCQGSLRSCLRAPVLDYVAKCNDALVYGTGNRDEDEIFRYYQKRGDGAVDNNVIVGLHKSEVKQLAAHLGLPQSVIVAVPSADLWGAGVEQTDEGELGLTYDEIEWVTRLNSSLDVLSLRGQYEPYPGALLRKQGDTATDDAQVEPAEAFRDDYKDKFTDRQFLVIEKAYHMEKASRHKAMVPPGPHRDDIEFFVI